MKNKSARKILQNTSEETKQKVRDWADQQIKKAMKLIKINTDHYVVVDDSEIKPLDWCLDTTTNLVFQYYTKRGLKPTDKKITHSTNILTNGMGILYLSEVKELLGEVDVEKKAEKFIGCKYDDIEDNIDQIGYDSFIRGYNQALEDNKEKKYTEEDVIRIVEKSRETGLTAEYLMMTLQPKTEWEVEIIDGKFKLKSFI